MRLLLVFLALLWASPSWAQEENPEEHIVRNDPGGLVVLELFSSQACIFCPGADQLFSDLMAIDNVIGLACHVDYFDVAEGSLAQPFCTQRQGFYQSKLRSGPNYTPQLVVNGSRDVVGYRLEDVTGAVRVAAKEDHVQPVAITRTENDNVFDVTLPKIEGENNSLELWVALQDHPHDIKIAAGGNKGEQVMYRNIASALESYGTWQGAAETIRLDLKLAAQHQGFIILAQDQGSGRIIAAGQYIAP